MKILLVNDVKPESLNGVSVSVSTLIKYFKLMGHDVRFLTLNESIRSNKSVTHGYRVGSIPTGFYPGIRWSIMHRGQIFEDIIEWNPDIVHSNCEFSTYYMAYSILKKCKIKPKWIHTFHTDYRYYVGPLTKVKPFTNSLIPKYLKKTFAKPDKIIVPSYKTKGFLLETDIVKSSKDISVIPCGISLSIDDVDNEMVNRLRKDLNLEGKKVIISLGRISREKNIDEVMEYFAEFSKKHNDYVLLICGVGPWVNHLKIKMSALKIADKVKFYINIPHELVPTYLRLGDVFVSSSMSETQGMTYYEALLCGVPVCATDKECLKGVIKEGENGAFYNDVNSFEKAIISCENMKREHSILGFDCSGQAFAERVIKLYKETTE